MNINEDGSVGIDLAQIATEIDGLKHNTNDGVFRRQMQRITAEINLDIAVSLRALAAEATLAMGDLDKLDGLGPINGDDAPEDPDDRDFLVEGDLVHHVDSLDVGVVVAVGVTEDEAYADVEWGSVVRVWQRLLVRLRGDERPGPDPLAEVILADGKPASIGADGIPILEDRIESEPAEVAVGMAEDLDDEFEGDDFTASESALEKLRKLEKKPAKKTAPKKKEKKP